MEYDLKKWVLRIWVTDRRTYIGEVKQNIFGQWFCQQTWGSRTTRFRRSRDFPAATYEDALALLDTTAKRRAMRGYRRIE